MFAALSSQEQSGLVLDVLQRLLGDAPTKADYEALLTTTNDVLTLLRIAVNHMPSQMQMLQMSSVLEESANIGAIK